MNNEGLIINVLRHHPVSESVHQSLILYSWTQKVASCCRHKKGQHPFDLEREEMLPGEVHYLDTGCGEDVFHQVLVDPGVSLQPLAADPNDLGPLQQAHLQLERHGYLPEVARGPTLQGIPK